MDYLNWLDYTSMIFYLSVIMGIGIIIHIVVYLKKKGEAGLEDYFLGGRKLPWWALGIAGMAHSLDLGGTMLIVSLFYIIGPRGLFIEFRGGTSLILALMLIFTAKYHQRSKCITGAQWMIFRFGDGFGGRFAQLAKVFGGVAFTLGMLALLIKGAGGFLTTFIPLSPTQCTLIMMGVATLYSMISGFHGVVIADLFQATIILGVTVYVVVAATMKIGGCEDFGALATSVTGQKDWMSSVVQWKTTMPKGYESYRYLLLFVVCYLGKTIFNGMSTGDDPKNFGSKDEVSACKVAGTWMTTLTIRWPMMMAFAVLGIFMVSSILPDQKVLDPSALAIKQHFVNEHLTKEGKESVMLDYQNDEKVATIVPRDRWITDANKIFAAEPGTKYFEKAKKLQETLGENWREELGRLASQRKLVAGVIPKSKWDATITDIVNHSEDYPPELVAQLKDGLGEENWASKMHLVSWEGTVNPEKVLPSVVLFMTTPGFRGLILIALIAASMSTFDMSVNMCAGLLVKDVYNKYVRPKASNRELIFASWGCVVLIVVLAFQFAYRVTSINSIWAWQMMGLFPGLTIPMLLRLYWWRFNGGGYATGTIVGIATATAQFIFVKTWPDLAISKWLSDELILMVTVSVVGLIASIIGTFLTQPTDRKLLERFYRTTRPIGFWGPLKSCLSADIRARMEKEHANDLVSAPFVLLFQITLLLMPVLLVIQSFGAFWVTLVLFLVSVAGIYQFWYRNLPPSGNWEPELVIDDPGVPEELSPVTEAAVEDDKGVLAEK